MQTFIFAVEDSNGDSRSMVRVASTWLTAWEVLSRKIRNAEIGKCEPVAKEWLTSTIAVYDAQFKVVAKGSKADLDKKLCFDAIGKTEFVFGVSA